MLLRHEDLLHFLINDIIKYGFFQNNNYDNFINIIKNMKIDSCLISNLQNEHMLDEKIKKEEEKISQVEITNVISEKRKDSNGDKAK